MPDTVMRIINPKMDHAQILHGDHAQILHGAHALIRKKRHEHKHWSCKAE